jgi:hypothetical protein
VPDCSASDTNFLLVGCAVSTAAAPEGTASRIVVDVGAGLGPDIAEGDSA